MADDTMAYVGMCPAPGCTAALAATVDDGKHPKDVRKHVNEFMRDGLVIQRMTVAQARPLLFRCEHVKAKT